LGGKKGKARRRKERKDEVKKSGLRRKEGKKKV
jgi:hypothetical protein